MICLLEFTANLALLPELQVQVFFMVVELLEVGLILLEPYGNPVLGAGFVYRQLFLLDAERTHESFHSPLLIDGMSTVSFVVDVFSGVMVGVWVRHPER